MISSIENLSSYKKDAAEKIRSGEELCDHYEDILGTYLVHLSSERLSERESEEATELLKSIGDFERISDHAVNILESAEELREKNLSLTEKALTEYDIISSAVCEVLRLSLSAFTDGNLKDAESVEPLEQVVDELKEKLRTSHILRMQNGQCSVEVGFVWSDILTNLERVSDHCSNIAGCVIDTANHNLNVHESLRESRDFSPDYEKAFKHYSEKYAL